MAQRSNHGDVTISFERPRWRVLHYQSSTFDEWTVSYEVASRIIFSSSAQSSVLYMSGRGFAFFAATLAGQRHDKALIV